MFFSFVLEQKIYTFITISQAFKANEFYFFEAVRSWENWAENVLMIPVSRRMIQISLFLSKEVAERFILPNNNIL